MWFYKKDVAVTHLRRDFQLTSDAFLLAFLLAGCTTNGSLQESPDIEGLIYDKQEKTMLVVEGIEDITLSMESYPMQAEARKIVVLE